MSAPASRPQTPVDAALALAELGFAIVPVDARSKKLAITGKVIGSRTRETILAWWKKHPDRNVGVVHGERSKLIVVDGDPRNGGDESIARLLQQNGELPRTPTARTGGGGRHHLFRWDGSVRGSKGKVAPGIDILAGGGFFLVEPSIHPDGGRYEWIVSPWECPVAPLPPWLRTLAQTANKVAGPITKPGANEAPRPKCSVRPLALGSGPILEGTRNDSLYFLACRWRAFRASESDILAGLLEANETRCQPPLEHADVARIAASACSHPPGFSGLSECPAITTLVMRELLHRGEPGALRIDRDGWARFAGDGALLARYPVVEAEHFPLLQSGSDLAAGSLADRVVREIARAVHRQYINRVQPFTRLTYPGGLSGFCDVLGVNRGQRNDVRAILEELQAWRGGRRDVPPVLVYWLKKDSARGRRASLRIDAGEALVPGYAKTLKTEGRCHPGDRRLLPVLPPPVLPRKFNRKERPKLCRLSWELVRSFRDDLRSLVECGGWEVEPHVKTAARRAGMDVDRARKAVDAWARQETGWLLYTDDGLIVLRDPAAHAMLLAAWRHWQDVKSLIAGGNGNGAT